MNQNKDPAYVLEGAYTAADLRHFLQRLRRRPVPRETLKYWRKALGIVPDQFNLYTACDLDLLKGLVLWLARGGTIRQYDQLIQNKVNNHG
jgi:DNA-binding transcriptional MerR regulator